VTCVEPESVGRAASPRFLAACRCSFISFLIVRRREAHTVILTRSQCD
jgi:hypothetical protein